MTWQIHVQSIGERKLGLVSPKSRLDHAENSIVSSLWQGSHALMFCNHVR